MKKWFIVLFLSILILGCAQTELDVPAKQYDFSSVIVNSGFDKNEFITNLEMQMKKEEDLFAKGDIALMLGRLKNNHELIFLAHDFYYRKIEFSNNWEEKAILFETIASLENSKYYYLRAADAWRKVGNKFRSKLALKLSFNSNLDLEFDLSELEDYSFDKKANEGIVIGNSQFELTKDDLIVSQTDRVTRDWLSYQLQNPFSNNILKTFSERLTYPEEELLPEIGWHEGARVSEIKDFGIEHKIATSTIVAKYDGKWYAPNEEGIFMFEVPEDKILYPTTRFFREDLAMVVDTHGINMLVDQAMNYKATAVIGCCDYPGKIKAAKYLSDKGLKVICNTDRFLPELMASGANVLGSAPFKISGDKLLFGDRPMEISLNEPIIVMDTVSEEYGMSYYDTPARYFSKLELEGIDLNIIPVEVNDFDQMDKVIMKARLKNSNIIAIRLFSLGDYKGVKKWLEEDSRHKAILFHSEAYPYGYKLAREFQSQTSFDDINPILI
ncbi:MAG: hypothetical protein KKF52_03925 [Nanoarchaeota archaeon]|nr:hypothetical protein [Nanoarchaeota archaeon]MBU4351920.1 hypothetical protein [Nanoarchaeota archaeon]